jgi:hypothetical protein
MSKRRNDGPAVEGKETKKRSKKNQENDTPERKPGEIKYW